MSLETMRRLHTSLTHNNFTVGATPIQISGGPATNWPLTGVQASFQPSYFRQGFTVTNNSTGGQIVSVGTTNSIATTGPNVKSLAPGQGFFFEANGSAVYWIVASAAGATVEMEEWQ